MGGAAALSIVAGFIGLRWSVSIYGFQTTETFSILGMSIISILLFKGITAFGLLNEKDWAILFAQIDGFAGVLICVISMLLPLYIPEYKFEFRIEILFLFSYLQKMNQIKKDWSAIT